MLKNVPGVEAAFLDDINNKQIKVYLVAAEQHLIDIDIIIKAEEIFERATGRDLEFIAWAHQGRDLDSLLPGMKRIF